MEVINGGPKSFLQPIGPPPTSIYAIAAQALSLRVLRIAPGSVRTIGVPPLFSCALLFRLCSLVSFWSMTWLRHVRKPLISENSFADRICCSLLTPTTVLAHS